MDSLVPAFVAALLAGVGDRPAWLAAILADRYGVRVLIGVAAAQALVMAVAAAGGAVIAPHLNPSARALLLAVALLFAGAAALGGPRSPERLEGWRIGWLGAAFLGMFSLALGDRTAFLAFGLAGHGPSPLLAAVGAGVGTLLLAGIAATLGEGAWRRLPLRGLNLVGAALLLGAGLIVGLDAFRII